MRSGNNHFFIFKIKGEIIARHLSRKKPKAEHLVNENIPFSKLFVLSNSGEKLGLMTKSVALTKAKEKGLDLVVIFDNPKQPVAKILDYGKFKYRRKKKKKESKLKQKVVNNREIRLTPMIGEHDLMVKSKKAREFILEGDRVKISLKFRGRELARKELGYEKIDDFLKTLEDICKIDKPAKFTGGRFLDVYISKDNKKVKKEEDKNAKNEN